MTAQQSDALREIANKARVTTILQSKAWKDTQRILQRSGLVYRGEQSEPFDPENILTVIRCVICTSLT